MDYSALIEKVRSLPNAPIYRNSTEVCKIGDVSLDMWDVITATVISGLNVLLLGERGDGKTQLALDIKNVYFGGNALDIRANPDLKVKDIYTRLNLEKLASGKGTTKDAIEISDSLRKPLTFYDEINRVPQITQNQALSNLDGYITLEEIDRTIFFGVDGYHVAIATANIGDGYTGTFPFDLAYLDRSHLIINVGNFPPTSLDLLEIAENSTAPKVIDIALEDHLSAILDIWKEMGNFELTMDGIIAELYLKKGYDYCERSPTERKTSVKNDIPNLCEGCNRLGIACGYIMPSSTRAYKAIKVLPFGLRLVADAKSGNEISETPRIGYREIIETFKITAPYSGILDRKWITEEHHGNPYLAMDTVYGNLLRTFEERIQYFKKAFSNALQGNLKDEDIEDLDPEFSWLREIFGMVNFHAKDKTLERISFIHDGQTIFGDPLDNIQFNINQKLRQELRETYGIVFATKDGIYVWHEGKRSEQQVYGLEQGMFGKREVSNIAVLKGKVLFTIDNKVYDLEHPDKPLENSRIKELNLITSTGSSIIGSINNELLFSRDGQSLDKLLKTEEKITAIASAPAYRLRNLMIKLSND